MIGRRSLIAVECVGLHDVAKMVMDTVTVLSADVDGVPIQSLSAYRVQSPLSRWKSQQ